MGGRTAPAEAPKCREAEHAQRGLEEILNKGLCGESTVSEAGEEGKRRQEIDRSQVLKFLRAI